MLDEYLVSLRQDGLENGLETIYNPKDVAETTAAIKSASTGAAAGAMSAGFAGMFMGSDPTLVWSMVNIF